MLSSFWPLYSLPFWDLRNTHIVISYHICLPCYNLCALWGQGLFQNASPGRLFNKYFLNWFELEPQKQPHRRKAEEATVYVWKSLGISETASVWRKVTEIWLHVSWDVMSCIAACFFYHSTLLDWTNFYLLSSLITSYLF
jgi:hypothetical protein